MDGSVAALSNGQARIVAISFSGVTDTVLVVVDAPAADGGVVPRLIDASHPGAPGAERPVHFPFVWGVRERFSEEYPYRR